MGTIDAIIHQHAEEVAFLWSQRIRAISAPHIRLADLVRLDRRLDAHFDGIRVNGHSAREIVHKNANAGDIGAVFAAAVLALESVNSDIAFILVTACKQSELAHGLISGVGWCKYEPIKSIIQKLCGSDDPAERRIGIAGAAIHRQHPGPSLTRAFLSKVPSLLARTCKAVGELAAAEGRAGVQGLLTSADPAVRYRAAWAGTLAFGDAAALGILQRIAETGGRFSEEAARLAARRLDPARAATWWRQQLTVKPARLRAAIAAAGAAGDPAAVPWLIQQMAVPGLARRAGEALSFITGVHIAYDKLEGKRPEGFESGPNDDPGDENVEMDPDDNLAWPDPGAVTKWWAKKSGEYANGTRYLIGKPMTIENLQRALRVGYQRQRAAAAIELAIRNPGQPLFEVRARGDRQMELLGLTKQTQRPRTGTTF